MYEPWAGFEPAGTTQDSGGAVWQVNLRHARFASTDKASDGEYHDPHSLGLQLWCLLTFIFLTFCPPARAEC